MKPFVNFCIRHNRILAFLIITVGCIAFGVNHWLEKNKEPRGDKVQAAQSSEEKKDEAPKISKEDSGKKSGKKSLNENAPETLPLSASKKEAEDIKGVVDKKLPMQSFNQAGLRVKDEREAPSILGTAADNLKIVSESGGNVTQSHTAKVLSISIGDETIEYTATSGGRVSQNNANLHGDELVDSSGIPQSPAERRKTRKPDNMGQQDSTRILANGLQRVTREDLAYAPYGRQVRCELLNTVESYNTETPIIGKVVENLYWNGKLIVPAGSEVHGKAAIDTQRERITSGIDWRIILPKYEERPSGTELRVKGVVLDRGEDVTKTRYSITDGSFGMMGQTIKTTDMEELKVFVSTFMASFASGLQDVRSVGNDGGTAPENNARNAALTGVSSVLSEYAKQIQAEIKAKGFYIRVPAGKQFYLYVQQTVVPAGSDIPLPPEIPANQEFEIYTAEHQAKVRQASGDDGNDSIANAVEKKIKQQQQ